MSQSNNVQSVCFVIVYLGKFPPWLPAFLVSCGGNPNINWLIFTDATIPSSKPENVTFQSINLATFIEMASYSMGCDVSFTKHYKLCDFKPIYGAIFSEYLKKYNYWGHCDLDVIWGDIESFLREIDFNKYDIISSRKISVSGHFTLYKNTSEINQFFKQVPNYHKVFIKDGCSRFDEGFFCYHLYKQSLNENFKWKIYWPSNFAVDRWELEKNPFGWHWSNGKILGLMGTEHVYIHFMNWKKSLRKIDFSYDDLPDQFKITKHGIWSKSMGLIQRIKYLSSLNLKILLIHYFQEFYSIIRSKFFKKNDKLHPHIKSGYEIIE